MPQRFYSVVYKGSGLIDLRAAALTAPVTTIIAVSYKSRTEILLPPGIRVELGGTGVSAVGEAPDARAGWLAPDAPLVHVRGVAYKGSIDVKAG